MIAPMEYTTLKRPSRAVPQYYKTGMYLDDHITKCCSPLPDKIIVFLFNLPVTGHQHHKHHDLRVLNHEQQIIAETTLVMLRHCLGQHIYPLYLYM